MTVKISEIALPDANHKNKPFDAEDAAQFYDWLKHKPGEWTEIRVIDPDPDKRESKSFFVDSREDFLKICRQWNGCRHVYCGINPRKRQSGTAGDVSRITGFPLDVDPPKRMKHASATEPEKQVAHESLQEILKYGKERQFGKPYLDDSGNGYRLAFKVNFPIEDHDKLKKFFEEFKTKFPLLDNIADLPRVIKVPGTWSLKGKNTPQRPHRQSKLIQLGDLEPNKNLESYILGLTAVDSATEVTEIIPEPPLKVEMNQKKIWKLRPCFRRFLREGGRFTPKGDRPSESRMRQQFVKEMASAGFRKNEILVACVKFDDYEKEKTEYEISRVYNEIMREGLTHWTCKSIRKHGACLGPECRLYAVKIEGTVRTKIGNYRLKRRGNKAFLFDENDNPVDSCKLDSVDGPRFKKKLVETYKLEKEEVNRATASFSLALQSIKKKGKTPEKEPEEEDFDEETENKARELLEDPAFFYKLGKVFEHGFVVYFQKTVT